MYIVYSLYTYTATDTHLYTHTHTEAIPLRPIIAFSGEKIFRNNFQEC